MKVKEGIYVLEMPVQINKRKVYVYPSVLYDNEELVIVDTGFPGQIERLKAEIEKHGLRLDRIKKIILTHHDIDHVGCAKVLINENQQIKIMAHREEKDYLNGKKKALKIQSIEKKLKYMPEGAKDIFIRMKKAFELCKVETDVTLEEGDVLAILGGTKVIYTPGHTKGHISLYIEKDKILIAGDCLSVENGELKAGEDSMHDDVLRNKESIKRFLSLDIEKVICYHGGIFTGKVKESIKKLI